MSATKALAVCLAIIGVPGARARADVMGFSLGSGQVISWTINGSSASQSSYTPPAPPSGGTYDAYLNFGTSPAPEADTLTTGNPQSWATSPVVEKWFGGQAPNAQQQSDFENAVLADVKTTFSLAGINPSFTLDPKAQADHTLSVVSGASYASNPNAIGITDVGGSGFSFIDKLQYAQSLTDLEWAVAHNISHELMHAFGVAVHHDQTGTFLDAGTATWALLTDPKTTFSAAAAADILSHASGRASSTGGIGAEVITVSHHVPGHPIGCQCPLCRNGYCIVQPPQVDGDLEILGASPVPEPTTWLVWGLGLAGVALRSRRRAA